MKKIILPFYGNGIVINESKTMLSKKRGKIADLSINCHSRDIYNWAETLKLPKMIFPSQKNTEKNVQDNLN